MVALQKSIKSARQFLTSRRLRQQKPTPRIGSASLQPTAAPKLTPPNLIARPLKPHLRESFFIDAFVYNHHLDWRNSKNDLRQAARDYFHPLDGRFRRATSSSRSSTAPIDFQAREPVSPGTSSVLTAKRLTKPSNSRLPGNAPASSAISVSRIPIAGKRVSRFHRSLHASGNHTGHGSGRRKNVSSSTGGLVQIGQRSALDEKSARPSTRLLANLYGFLRD